ncbi:MAG: hypothetical protein JW797_16585 [Bradymonadales bacterium]|nr:hypothetical protein [Bradymonadales bacterium]
MSSDTRLQNIGLIMVHEGLLSREALERAVRRKQASGGSLALNLVMEGAVDENRLVEFYAQKLNLTLAPQAMLAGIDRTIFSLIPLEICYDGGLLPLYLKDQETLVVGQVDPSDEDLLVEVAFFSGYTIEPRLITVSQMAIHFNRLADRPWKIGVEEALTLQQGAARGRRLDDEIAALFEQTTALDHHLDHILATSLDVTYGPSSPDSEESRPEQQESLGPPPAAEGPSVWLMEETAKEISRIRIMAAGPGNTPTLVEAQDVDRLATAPSAQKLPPESPLPSEAGHGFTRISTRPITLRFDRQDETEPVPSEQATSGVVEGEAITRTGPVKVLGVYLDQLGEPDKVLPAPFLGPTEQYDSVGRSEVHPGQPVPALRGRQEVSGSYDDQFRSLADLALTLAPADPAVESTIWRTCELLGRARQRDELGDLFVLGLAAHYQTIAIMTLNGPRAVIWRCLCQGLDTPRLVGKGIEMEERSILHRVSQEGLFFWGPLPARCRLRETLQVPHVDPVLVAPVQLRGRTILIVVLDAGARPFPSPGDRLQLLLSEMSRGLQRVILQRKHAR